ncbi:epoxide hydrolase, soluble (sEH), partial [Nowakowskiella sp. JEL0078]
YSICWCPDRGPSSLVVGVGPIVKIYRKDSNGKWAQTEIMRCGDEKDDKSGELVTDVSWSPSFGRAAQFIAVGSTFGKIRIYKIFDDISKSKTGQYKKELIVEFLNDENKRDIMEGLQRGSRNAVWKVDWNAMGNVLSCCSDDGCVRLWKAGYLGDWMCLAVLKSE